MNRGIFINGETRKGRLSVYQLTDWPSGETALKMHNGPTEALQAHGLAGVAWIAGTAATNRLAKQLGLQLRRRAPGAGRSRIDNDKKAKRVTVWLKPELIPEFKALAQRFKEEKNLK